MCEQDKLASSKGLLLHSKVAMRRLDIGKEHIQHNIVDRLPGISTDPDR